MHHRLPQEIIDRIVSYLDRYPNQQDVPNIQQQGVPPSALPPYATISAQFKEAVEFITFHRLRIGNDELDAFRAIVTQHRCKYVRRLAYTVLLPEYPQERGNCLETSEEQDANNEVFTQSIADLFSILRQWEHAGRVSNLRFHLKGPETSSDNMESEKRWDNAHISLSDTEKIPKIASITYFQVEGNHRRTIPPSLSLQLLTLLPNVKHIYGDYNGDFVQSNHTTERLAFASTLHETRLPNNSVAMFDFHSEPPFDQREPTSSCLPPHARYDPFSASLRSFSQNLKTFILSAYIDSTLFWPSPHEPCPTPSWPSLRKLKLSFNPVAPSGEWYFDGTPRDAEDTQFLRHGNTHTLDPLLTAFARATQCMPVLETFMLECDIGHDVGFFEISWYAPGVRADWSLDWGEERAWDVRRLYYCVGERWRSDGFVGETLRGVGRERFGGEVREEFLGHRSWNSDRAWSWL